MSANLVDMVHGEIQSIQHSADVMSLWNMAEGLYCMSANYDQMLYSIGHMVYTITPNGRRYSYRNPILVHLKVQFMTMLE